MYKIKNYKNIAAIHAYYYPIKNVRNYLDKIFYIFNVYKTKINQLKYDNETTTKDKNIHNCSEDKLLYAYYYVSNNNLLYNFKSELNKSDILISPNSLIFKKQPAKEYVNNYIYSKAVVLVIDNRKLKTVNKPFNLSKYLTYKIDKNTYLTKEYSMFHIKRVSNSKYKNVFKRIKNDKDNIAVFKLLCINYLRETDNIINVIYSLFSYDENISIKTEIDMFEKKIKEYGKSNNIVKKHYSDSDYYSNDGSYSKIDSNSGDLKSLEDLSKDVSNRLLFKFNSKESDILFK